MEDARHRPVLLAEAVESLAPRAGSVIVDATFGAGGHTRALVAAGARVIAFDRDPTTALDPQLAGAVSFVRRSFVEIDDALDELGVATVDGVLFDLGVSSMQFDRPERGFSLLADGPLDMRMDPAHGESAAGLLARVDEDELAEIIATYGEDRAARRIARAVVTARRAGRAPATTLELARLVAGVVHVRGRRERTHPATRTFQALRIAVNDELRALERGLAAATERTRAGGRIVAISFHSLEDRIVKQTFRDDARLVPLHKKPRTAQPAEVAGNPRSRSAKLRAAERAE